MNAPLVNLTLPVFNEEAQLADSVGTVCRFLEARFEFPCEVVIANNGSTDGTQDIADQLERQWPQVRAVHLKEKGRGRALKRVWTESRAEVLTYMDVDLSTDLAAYPALVAAVAGGRHDVAVGSRTLPESRTSRGLKREFISRAYSESPLKEEIVPISEFTREIMWPISNAQYGYYYRISWPSDDDDRGKWSG